MPEPLLCQFSLPVRTESEHARRLSSLSVIIPALNEEKNLSDTIENVRASAAKYFLDWEILVFNDGSTDRTGQIAESLAKQDPKIRVFHHETPKNLAQIYRIGIRESQKDFLILVPGDNECGTGVINPVLKLAGRADMIIPYTANQQERSFLRKFLSHSFVSLINLVSGNSLRYYNGCVLHRTKNLKQQTLAGEGFGYQAELLVKMLRQGYSFLEVPTVITPRKFGKSKALRLSSIFSIGIFFWRLLWESRFNTLPVNSGRTVLVLPESRA